MGELVRCNHPVAVPAAPENGGGRREEREEGRRTVKTAPLPGGALLTWGDGGSLTGTGEGMTERSTVS